MLKLKSISPSRIKTFDACKFKYWLTYHCPEVTLKSNWGAAHGSLQHDVLEYLSTGEDTDPIARLYRGYGGVLETTGRYGDPETMESPLTLAKPKEYADKKPYCDTCPHATDDHTCAISLKPLDDLPGCPRFLFDKSVAMLEDAIERYRETWKKLLRDDEGKPIGAEYMFKLTVAGTDVPMIGIMDLVIEEDPETIHIIDYKTGVWTQSYEECLEDIQVKMYSLASRREFIDDVGGKGHKYKNVMLTFDYFTKNPITVAFTAEEDAETEEFVRRKIEEIQGTNWIDRVVRSNDDFTKRWAWKCLYLCDTEVCADKWEGRFQAK